MSAPQQPTGAYVPEGYQLKKKKPIWKRWWFWLLAIIALIAIGSAIGGGASSDSESSDGVSGGDTTTGDAPAGGGDAPAGPSFQGQQDSDLSAEPGQTITLDEVATTATPLVTADAFGTPVLCSTLTIVNNGDDAAPFNTFDFTLQDPAGASRNATFGGTDNDLGSGELAPGGTASGDVCFEGGSEPGQYALIYEATFSFSNERAVWVNNR